MASRYDTTASKGGDRALPAPLEAGRGAIAQRLLRTTALRFALISGSVTTLLLLVGPSITDRLALAIGGAFWGYVTGAFVGVRRAHRDWPRIWDRIMGLPNTVETCASICRQHHSSSSWSTAMLEMTHDIPQPGREALSRVPYRLQRGLAIVAIVVVLHGVALALPQSVENPRVEPATLLENAARFAESQGLDASIVEELRAAAGQGGETNWEQLVSRAQSSSEAARDRTNDRYQAAKLLGNLEETRPLGEWLIRGVTPEDLPELSQEARSVVERAARLLDATDEKPRRWLSDLARGVSRAAPEIDEASQEWRAATALAELLRSGARGTTTHRDDTLASGGTSSSGSRENSEDVESSTTDNEKTNSMKMSPGSRVGEGDVLPAENIVGTRLKGDPQWDRMLASPRVESHWIEVVDEYREILNRNEIEEQ